MLQKLKDIPRLLYFVRLYSDGGTPTKKYFQSEFNKSGVLEGSKQNYESVLEFCLDNDILKKNDEKIIVTELGNRILAHFDGNYDLNELQKEIISKNCLLVGNHSGNIYSMFKYFKHNRKNQTYYYQKSKITQICDIELLPLLYQADILIKIQNIIIFNQKYVPLILLYGKGTTKKSSISQSQLNHMLDIKDEVGEIAEEIVLEFEKNRLTKLGFLIEAANVEQISKSDVAAGYDIVSYDKLGDSLMNYDRFIEVKGSTGKKFSIYWSSNEIAKAEELGKKYWLYFVGNINRDNRKSSQEPEMIPDPFNNILNDSNYTKKIESYHITRNSNSKE